METLEESRMCRLCGKNSGISIDIFDKKESHVRKINAILPILVHELDLLPKQMCHRCSYKLEEFYNFYVACAKTDSELKSQLSWMRKEDFEEEIKTPMVKICPFKIKAEPKDENGSMDSDVFGHISESSLFFPASILQSTFDPNASPMLTCSRCRCLCSEGMKENKNSVKKKDSLDTESDPQAHTSTMTLDIANDSAKSLVHENPVGNNLVVKSDSKESKATGIPLINLENVKDGKLRNSDDLLHIDHLDRALRPRKGSVDYKCQKKKGLASNLKTKLKSTLDMLNPELVNPVDSVVAQKNATNHSPVIKLEKVDDTVKNLRTRKNLEQFNKSIKQFQRERKGLHKETNLRKRILRKSLHEGNHIKVLQKDGNHIETLQQSTEPPTNKSTATQNSENVVGLHLEASVTHEKLSPLSSSDVNNHSGKVIDVKVKQELISKATGDGKSPPAKSSDAGKSLKEKSVALDKIVVDSSNFQKIHKAGLSTQANPVVKEEKDNACNVDYPKLKITRHQATALPSKSTDNNSKSSMVREEKSNVVTPSPKKISQDDGTISPKNLRSKEKRPKVSDEDGMKAIRKKCRRLDPLTKHESPDKSKKLDQNCKQTNQDKSKKLDAHCKQTSLDRSRKSDPNPKHHSPDKDKKLELPSKLVSPEKRRKVDMPGKQVSPEKSKKSDLPSKQVGPEKSKKSDLSSKQVGPEKSKKSDPSSKQVSPEKSKKSDLPIKQAGHEKVMTTPPLKIYCEECDICFRNKEVYKLHPCYQK
ncbi:hypothetical protein QAD02_023143 [Eretmocerus hayati]|uniref:Uncharacterized protein n=1 Tax=Eretmocerus hayati TaxID=131215 RepID=A0ACC2PXH5_9HYME|nr:hypothetical protein QAD02_023143 [Eretmocerus hayati]